MKLPSGVDVMLSYQDATDDAHRPVLINEERQYIGALAVGKAVIDVNVFTSAANRIFGLAIDHKHGTVSLKRDLAKNPTHGFPVAAGVKFFQTKVPVVDSKDFIPTTKYPQNYMTLVELDADKPGLVRIWEIALVSQKGLFWVTTQCTYEVQCYMSREGDGFKFCCPFFETVKPYPHLVALLETLPMVKLPPVSEYVPPADPPKSYPDQGRVLWWNCAMGLGMIMTTEGVARVHWSNLKDAIGLAYLEKDDLVNYEELGTPFQTYERETSLKLEAFGARKIGYSLNEAWADELT